MKLPSHIQHWDDERHLGNGIIVTLAWGWSFDLFGHDAVHGFDNVTEAKWKTAKKRLHRCGCEECSEYLRTTLVAHYSYAREGGDIEDRHIHTGSHASLLPVLRKLDRHTLEHTMIDVYGEDLPASPLDWPDEPVRRVAADKWLTVHSS